LWEKNKTFVTSRELTSTNDMIFTQKLTYFWKIPFDKRLHKYALITIDFNVLSNVLTKKTTTQKYNHKTLPIMLLVELIQAQVRKMSLLLFQNLMIFVVLERGPVTYKEINRSLPHC
jgi:hypothetical protein